jgi:hypothetical protein
VIEEAGKTAADRNRKEKVTAAIEDLRSEMDRLLAFARTLNERTYFCCEFAFSDSRQSALRVAFADGTGKYFQRSFSLAKHGQKHGIGQHLDAWLLVKLGVQSYVLGKEHVSAMRHSMRKERVKVPRLTTDK